MLLLLLFLVPCMARCLRSFFASVTIIDRRSPLHSARNTTTTAVALARSGLGFFDVEHGRRVQTRGTGLSGVDSAAAVLAAPIYWRAVDPLDTFCDWMRLLLWWSRSELGSAQ